MISDIYRSLFSLNMINTGMRNKEKLDYLKVDSSIFNAIVTYKTKFINGGWQTYE